MDVDRDAMPSMTAALERRSWPYAEAARVSAALVEQRKAGRSPISSCSCSIRRSSRSASSPATIARTSSPPDRSGSGRRRGLRDRPRRRRHLSRPRPARRLSDPRPQAGSLRRPPLRARPRRGADPGCSGVRRRRPAVSGPDRRLGGQREARGDRRPHLPLGDQPRLCVQRSTTLRHFDLIVPCGITDKGVTSLERSARAARSPWMRSKRSVDAFAAVFERSPVSQRSIAGSDPVAQPRPSR